MKTAYLAALLATIALPAAAQTRGQTSLSFEMGMGLQSVPEYEGSKDNETKAWPLFRNFNISLDGQTPTDGGAPQGFSFGPSFDMIYKRKTDGSAPERLRGLDEVGYGLEAGMRAGYRSGPVRVYGAVRKGLGGHKGVVGEMGVSLTMNPADRWTVITSLEAQYGDDKYMDAYFGVNAAEAARSGLAEHNVSGGLRAHAVSVEARYQANDYWSVLGRVQAKRMTDDVTASPVVEERDQISVGLGVVRNFNFRF